MIEINEKIDYEKLQQVKTDRRYQDGEINKEVRDRLYKHSRGIERELKATYSKIENLHNEVNKLMDEFIDDIKQVLKRFTTASATNKRELIDIFCENFRVKDGKARFDWIKPFDAIALHASRSSLLPLKDLFRNQELELNISKNDCFIFSSLFKNSIPEFNYL